MRSLYLASLFLSAGVFGVCGQALIAPPYSAAYNLRDLGEAPEVPTRYGGLAFLKGDPNTLLVGGAGNMPEAQIYAVGLTRGANQHISGFTGVVSVYAPANGSDNGGIDGGMAYGPGDVLFFTSWPDNELCQIKPGQHTIAKRIACGPFGIQAVGSCAYVPAGLPGAGRFKLLDYGAGSWFDAQLVADGQGTYNLVSVSSPIWLDSGVEGAFYVAAGAPNFAQPAVLICDYSSDRISAYDLTATGDPVPSSRRDFVTEIAGAEGAARDPITGDFVFGTFADPGHIYVLGGFPAQTPPVVSLTSPTNGTVFASPQYVGLAATASQSGGSVSQVDFYVDGNFLESSYNAPYAASPFLSVGPHQLYAVAHGISSSVATSAVVNVTVQALGLIVVVTEPQDSQSFRDCTVIPLRASVSGGIGAVTNLTFYRNGIALGRGTGAPFSLMMTNLGVGTNLITASAADNFGATGTSPSVKVIVRSVPTNTVAILASSPSVFNLCSCGMAGTNYVLESAPALNAGQWAPIATNVPAAGRLGWIHTNTGPKRFYRTRYPG